MNILQTPYKHAMNSPSLNMLRTDIACPTHIVDKHMVV